MKHFVVLITYRASLEKIDTILPAHRKFLQIGYDKGMILMSGPRSPRTGGIIIARAESIEKVEEYFQIDPYKTNRLADYEFLEFEPVKHQDLIKSWLE